MTFHDYADNPHRVAGPGELRTDHDYDGDLLEDCDSLHEPVRTPNQVLHDAFLALKPDPLIGFKGGITVDGLRVDVKRDGVEDDGEPA